MEEKIVELSGTAQALGWSLVHFLWQGTLIALLLELVLVALRERSADLRYTVRCLGLVAMGLAPVITYFVVAVPETQAAGSAFGLLAAESVPAEGASFGLLWPFLVVLAWVIGAAACGARLLRDYLRIRSVQRGAGEELPLYWQARFDELAEALGVRAVARVVESASLAAPAVIGWVAPVVLLPTRVLTGLSQEQIEALIAHELAHVRRHDYLVNLIQSALEALLFYHPAVWWVSRGIRTEREYCCDDVALRVTADRVAYARALTILEGWRGVQPKVQMSTLGGSLMHRIQRMVGIRPSKSRSRAPLAALGALFLVSALGTTAVGYTSPTQDADEIRRLRAEIAEMRDTIHELKAMLHGGEREHGQRTEDRLHDRILLHPNTLRGFDYHEREGEGEQHHGDRHEVRHHDHDHDPDADHDFNFDFDYGDIHEQVQKALEESGIHVGHENGRYRVEIEGLPEPQVIHEHVQKALKDSGLNGDYKMLLHEFGKLNKDNDHHRIEVNLEGLEGLHEHIQKALENSNVKIDGLEVLDKIDVLRQHFEHSSDRDDERHEHVQRYKERLEKAHEDSFRFKLRDPKSPYHNVTVDIDGLEGLENLHIEGLKGLEDLKGLERLKGLESLKELEGLHELKGLGEHIRKALEEHGIYSNDQDGHHRIEIRGLPEKQEWNRQWLDAPNDLETGKLPSGSYKLHLKELEDVQEQLRRAFEKVRLPENEERHEHEEKIREHRRKVREASHVTETGYV